MRVLRKRGFEEEDDREELKWRGRVREDNRKWRVRRSVEERWTGVEKEGCERRRGGS